MISVRFAPAVAALLGVTLVPTFVHSYIGAAVADGRHASAIPVRLNGLDGRATARSSEWVRETFSSTDFAERHHGPDLTLFVARSYDAKRLYHHPELALAHGDSYQRAVVVRVTAHREVPVHALVGGEKLSVYALLHDERFVANPIRFQLENALALLIRPRNLMTLFFVRGRRMPEHSDRLDDTPAVELLLAAIDSFMAQPAAGSR